MAEVINISDVGTKPVINLNKNDDSQSKSSSLFGSLENKPSMNSGGGIELLMNDKGRIMARKHLLR